MILFLFSKVFLIIMLCLFEFAVPGIFFSLSSSFQIKYSWYNFPKISGVGSNCSTKTTAHWFFVTTESDKESIIVISGAEGESFNELDIKTMNILDSGNTRRKVGSSVTRCWNKTFPISPKSCRNGTKRRFY